MMEVWPKFSCENIKSKTHIVGKKSRKYKTECFLPPKEHAEDALALAHVTYKYIENPVIEYIFDGDCFAITGSDSHHFFGIVKDNFFYTSGFSKIGLRAQNACAFWDSFSLKSILYLKLEDKREEVFDQPINLIPQISLYWHWFNEDLPVFYFMSKNGCPIVTNKLTKWQKESLSFFPGLLEKVIEIDTPCIIKAPELHVFTYPAHSLRGKTSQWVSKFLNKQLIPNIKCKPFKKIYISRNDAAARGIDNESEVKSFLMEQGFTCYENFSSLSLQEKINLFYQSAIVIAPTGAGLTHCHAMQRGTVVVDFSHAKYIPYEYGWNNMGSAVGVRWITFAAQAGSQSQRYLENLYTPDNLYKKENDLADKNNNMRVDINSLARAIKHALG